MIERVFGLGAVRDRLDGLVAQAEAGDAFEIVEAGQVVAFLIGADEYDTLNALAARGDRLPPGAEK